MGVIDERLKELREMETAARARDVLQDGSGGGTSGGVTDDWKASVDRQLEQLHGDVRALLYGLIGGFLFVIAAGGAAYVSLSNQIVDGRKDVAGVQIEQAKAAAKLDLIVDRTAPAKNP